MILKGGYAMIDCAGLNLLSAESQSSTRIYAQMKEAIELGKPTFAYNIVYGENNPMTAVPVMVNYDPYSSTTIVATASVLQIFVEQDGSIRIVNLAPAN